MERPPLLLSPKNKLTEEDIEKVIAYLKWFDALSTKEKINEIEHCKLCQQKAQGCSNTKDANTLE
jgi:hypothetical protein